LLAFGRRQPIRPVGIELNARLDAFAELTARMLTSRIKVRLELDAKSALVEVDPVQLETALLNAAINARDAMPDGGELVIRTEDCEQGGRPAICISMRDSGMGIPADKLQRVFEPFFTTKDIGKGTGLGLSQIHGFAAQAGGVATIESEEGRGTTLRIALPATDKKLEKVAPDAPAANLPQGFAVLLVEDNDQVRQFAAALLRDLGCEVTEVADGSAAMDLIGRRRFDLLFSDVVMPGISGIELARQVAERPNAPPVLLASGYNDQYPVEAHGFSLIKKPYDAGSLGQAMADLHRDRADKERSDSPA
jgi:CheY-like chemotaxis protein/anti-sigma regulatory factor (Ser/Thr protein kinase)